MIEGIEKHCDRGTVPARVLWVDVGAGEDGDPDPSPGDGAGAIRPAGSQMPGKNGWVPLPPFTPLPP